MNINGYKKLGVTDKKVEKQLAFIIKQDGDENGRKKLFKRVKRLSKPVSLIAYYIAARNTGDPGLSAAIRDRLFAKAVQV